MFRTYRKPLCEIMLSFVWNKYIPVECLNQMIEVCLTLKKKKKPPNCSPKCLHHFSSPPAIYKNCGASTSLQIPGLFNFKHSNVCIGILSWFSFVLPEWLSQVSLHTLIFHPYIFFAEVSKTFVLFYCFIIEFWNFFIYIFYTNPLYFADTSFANIFC